jgi:hypothetical protein
MTSRPGAYDHPRAVQALRAVLAIAVLSSIVHYTDNYVNYADYPQSESLNPSRGLVLGSWFGFTAAGLAGYVLFRRRPSALALALLAAYSGSGLVGIGHFVVPGASAMPWWRQAHVVVDIACGVAMLAFVIWAARQRARYPPSTANSAPVT